MFFAMDYIRKVKLRIGVSALIILLGLASIVMSFMFKDVLLIATNNSFANGFYAGMGGGLIGAGIATLIKNAKLLKDADKRKEAEIQEKDERNLYISLNAWKYTGFAMLYILYIGIIISGFINVTVFLTLLCVFGVAGLCMLISYLILRKVV